MSGRLPAEGRVWSWGAAAPFPSADSIFSVLCDEFSSFPADSHETAGGGLAERRVRRARHFRAWIQSFQALAATFPVPADSHTACPPPIESGKPRACGSTGRGRAISGRGFNSFKLLRRHFRSSLCRRSQFATIGLELDLSH